MSTTQVGRVTHIRRSAAINIADSHYFDMDLKPVQDFKLERFNIAIGAQHSMRSITPTSVLPNSTYFSSLTGDLRSQIQRRNDHEHAGNADQSVTANFLGFDSSPRVMQLSFKLVF